MRLIDVEPIIEDLEREVELCNGTLDNMDIVSNTRKDLYVERNTILDLIQELKDEPTIDAIPVVRCKYCKHSRGDDVFGTRWCQKPGSIKVVKDELYCAYGERKDDADN